MSSTQSHGTESTRPSPEAQPHARRRQGSQDLAPSPAPHRPQRRAAVRRIQSARENAPVDQYNSRFMPFREDALKRIHEKKFDDVETLWMSELDRDPSDVDSFLAVAKALRKAEQRTQSDTLLGLLSDAEKEIGRASW